MKNIIFLLLISSASYAQPNISFAGGKSVNTEAVTFQAGIGTRIGSFGYAEIQAKGYTNGWPAASVGLLAGTAHSWNNGAGHELTTIFYVKADKVLAASHWYKDYGKQSVIGFGMKHYVFNGFIDLSYQHGQAVFAVGYSINSLFR